MKGVVINTQGSSLIKAEPDLIKIYFNIETKGETTSESSSANADILDRLTINLLREGLERKDILTMDYSIYPNGEWINGNYIEKGFKTSHQIAIELPKEKFSLAGKIIDAGAEAGATVNYINFELSKNKENEYKAQAFKLASEDARIKAESIAEGLGKEVSRVVSVSTNEWGYNPWRVYSTKGMDVMEENRLAKEATMNIQPSSKDITGFVSVSFRIK
jgi:uncharacterized protein YggE